MSNTDPRMVAADAAIQASIDEGSLLREDPYLKDVALGHVVKLFMANATKDTNPGKSFPDMSKSVHDLIHDAKVIEEYLLGNFDVDDDA